MTESFVFCFVQNWFGAGGPTEWGAGGPRRLAGASRPPRGPPRASQAPPSSGSQVLISASVLLCPKTGGGIGFGSLSFDLSFDQSFDLSFALSFGRKFLVLTCPEPVWCFEAELCLPMYGRSPERLSGCLALAFGRNRDLGTADFGQTKKHVCLRKHTISIYFSLEGLGFRV